MCKIENLLIKFLGRIYFYKGKKGGLNNNILFPTAAIAASAALSSGRARFFLFFMASFFFNVHLTILAYAYSQKNTNGQK